MNRVLGENEQKPQKDALEELFNYEKRFRKTLLSTPEGKDMYRQFMEFILKEKCNILSSRVYFRERQDIFAEKISPAFQKQKPHLLYSFRINYFFAKWVIERYNGPKIKSLKYSYDKIVKIRKTLCENNLPLALNRAKIFWSKVPDSHLEYMDIVQTSSEGLLTAIDKFVPPYKTVFRSVAIGRMTLNMLTDHNATVIKLSPIEKRILYRANNARTKENLTEIKDILRYVRQSFKGVTLRRLEEILNAGTQIVSLDEEIKNEGSQTDTTSLPTNRTKSTSPIMASDSPSPESQAISSDIIKKMVGYLHTLPPIEEKVLRMKMGIEYEG